MTISDPLADLRREIILTTPADRAALARALNTSENAVMHALGIGLLEYNRLERESAIAYEVDKLTPDQLEELAPHLPPLPRATGGPRDFDPDTKTFRPAQPGRDDDPYDERTPDAPSA